MIQVVVVAGVKLKILKANHNRLGPLPLVTIEATAAEVLPDGRHDLLADLYGDDSRANVHQVFNCLADFFFDIVR